MAEVAARNLNGTVLQLWSLNRKVGRLKWNILKKQAHQLANKSELERLKEELAKKNQELYETKMERDILKKSLSLFGPSKPGRKLK